VSLFESIHQNLMKTNSIGIISGQKYFETLYRPTETFFITDRRSMG